MQNLMTVTPAIARAAGQDAANKRMRAAGRSKWNHFDMQLACETQARLMQQYGDYCEQLAADDVLRRMAKPLPKNVPF